MSNIVVSVEAAQAMIGYMKTRPYEEVYTFIEYLRGAEVVEDPPVEEAEEE